MIIAKLRDVKTPTRGTSGSAGYDFFIPDDHEPITIPAGGSVNIKSGIRLVIPSGFVGIFFNKSGVGVKGVLVGAQVVDSDYRGEVHLNVHNVSPNSVVFSPGQKLVQMLIQPVVTPEVMEITAENYDANVPTTKRGSGGFGSTGV